MRSEFWLTTHKLLIVAAIAVLATLDLTGAAFAGTLSVAKAGSGSGSVTGNGSDGTISCGTTCRNIYPDGTLITLTASPGPGNQFTGWLGPCTGMSSCQFTINGSATVLATFAATDIGAPGLDIDGTGACDALTDGLLVLRYLLGLSGTSMFSGALGAGATRVNAAQLGDYLNDVKPVLDIDGNGEADALTDGLLILRYMFGLRGASLIAGAVGPGATRMTAVGIETQIANLYPPSPAIGFVYPVPNQRYVGFGQVVSGGIANQQNVDTALVADIAANVTAVAGSVITLRADGTPVATSTLPRSLVAQTVSLNAVNIPIPAGAPTTTHTLTLEVREPDGVLATSVRNIEADVFPPGAVAPTFSITNRLAGVVQVTIPTLPGDDGAQGATPPQWEIRYSLASPLTAANWAADGKLLVNNLGGSLPSQPTQSFDLFLPTDQTQVWIGIRAIDRVGNLGSFVDQTAAPTLSTTLSRTNAVTVPNADTADRVVMKVADVDGDGYDDLIAAYPMDHGGDGRIYIWFGGSGGISNAAAPMVLVGSLASGSFGVLASGNAFEVADLDGDGIADIIAGETDCASTAYVNVWKGSAIAAMKASNGLPAAIRLSDGNNLIGGTLRAAGKATGGNAAGRDLLLTNYTVGCTAPATLTATILPRGGTWLSNGNTAVLSAAGAVTIALPNSPNGTVDATWFTQHSFTTRDSMAISVDEPNAAHELQSFSGDLFTAGASIAWSSGVKVTPQQSDGLVLGGGRDAFGDGTTDLVVSQFTDKRVVVYDGHQLLSGAGPIQAATLNPNGDANGDAGRCAALLPDLDGDGKADYAGCSATGSASAVYLGFGFTGASPPWSTIAVSGVAQPGRSQRIGSGGAVFGQAVAAGHVTSKTALDLVVLSHASTGHDTIWLIR